MANENEQAMYIANSLETEFGSAANRARLAVGNCNRILKSKRATAEQKEAAADMKAAFVKAQRLGNVNWAAIAEAE